MPEDRALKFDADICRERGWGVGDTLLFRQRLPSDARKGALVWCEHRYRILWIGERWIAVNSWYRSEPKPEWDHASEIAGHGVFHLDRCEKSSWDETEKPVRVG